MEAITTSKLASLKQLHSGIEIWFKLSSAYEKGSFPHTEMYWFIKNPRNLSPDDGINFTQATKTFEVRFDLFCRKTSSGIKQQSNVTIYFLILTRRWCIKRDTAQTKCQRLGGQESCNVGPTYLFHPKQEQFFIIKHQFRRFQPPQ